MRPVHQTVFGKEEGNCLQAAVASLFDLELDDVPHFIGEPDWWRALQNWLHPRGLHCTYVTQYADQPGYYLEIGESPRGEFHHVVVVREGKLAHDPHPDGTGLSKRTGEYIFGKVFTEQPQ